MRKYRTLALGAASLALILSACSPGGSAGSPSGSAAATKPTVKVGSAGFWESAVVAEAYAQALEAKGYTVERHLEIGERPALHAALTSGQVNLIPEYLGGLAGQVGERSLHQAGDHELAALGIKAGGGEGANEAAYAVDGLVDGARYVGNL